MNGDWFVYWLKNPYGDCIYVGVTTCLDRRWKEHQRRLGGEIQGVASAGPFTRQQALAVEKIEQRRLAPKYVGNLKKLPNRFSTYLPELPCFESEPLLPEDFAGCALRIDELLGGVS